MKPKRTTVIYLLPFFLLLLFQSALAQVNPRFEVSFRDSLETTENYSFINNSIKITNKNTIPISLIVSVSIPNCWRLISNNKKEFLDLAPGETQYFPQTFLKLHNSSAQWLPVQILIHQKGIPDSFFYQFQIKANTLDKFRIVPFTQEILLSKNINTYSIVNKIVNEGTTNGKYKINYSNQYLGIKKDVKASLSPGEDTLLSYSFSIPKRLFKNISHENLFVNIKDSTEIPQGFSVNLIRLQSSVKLHASQYDTAPFELEFGALSLNKQLSYFGNVKGAINIKKSKFNFSYRSKEFGNYNRLDRNVFNISFISKKWEVFAGQMTESRQFYSFGNGLKIVYKNNKSEVLISGVKHRQNPFITNDNITAIVKYTIGKIETSHTLSLDIDSLKQNTSYLLFNEFKLIKNKHLLTNITAGVGMDNSYFQSRSIKKGVPGISLGYLFSYTTKKIEFSSNILNYDYNYPGINKGSKMQSHNLKWVIKNKYISLFYQYNSIQSNILQDTIYNTDILTFNMKRYGINVGLSGTKYNLSLSSGSYQQAGLFGSSLPKYTFGELYYSLSLKNDVYLTANSISGYNHSYGINNKAVWFTNTSFDTHIKAGGIKAHYLQLPEFNFETKEFARYSQTILVVPYINFNLFRKLATNLSYSISKSLYDNSVNTYAGFNLKYADNKTGLRVSLYGSIPLSQHNPNSGIVYSPNRLNNEYLRLSLHKKFNTHLFAKRKYHNLTVQSFIDINSNGIKDANEEGIKNVQVKIKRTSFISDARGLVAYKNIDTGFYKISFEQLHELKGLVPVAETQQVSRVFKNTLVQVPFKKSRVISGLVKVVLDSLNNTKFTPENIRVTATDSTGASFSTFTDASGQYFLNLVSNVYTISLNGEAFNDKMKPVVLSYRVDLREKEEEKVNFEVREKKREIRYLKNN